MPSIVRFSSSSAMVVTGRVSHGGLTGYRGVMPVAMRQSRRFAAPSPVARYWLANCVGFTLAGGGRGEVERVLADENPHEPSVLEVRTSRRRVRHVPASAVVAVVPQEQVLVVDGRRRLTPDRRRDVSLRLRWGARVLRRILVVGLGLVLALATELWRLGRRAWAEGSPAVARTSRRGGSEAARLVRSVPWQSYCRTSARTPGRKKAGCACCAPPAPSSSPSSSSGTGRSRSTGSASPICRAAETVSGGSTRSSRTRSWTSSPRRSSSSPTGTTA